MNIPDELTWLIFSFLPIQTIFRCKSVCKQLSFDVSGLPREFWKQRIVVMNPQRATTLWKDFIEEASIAILQKVCDAFECYSSDRHALCTIRDVNVMSWVETVCEPQEILEYIYTFDNDVLFEAYTLSKCNSSKHFQETFNNLFFNTCPPSLRACMSVLRKRRGEFLGDKVKSDKELANDIVANVKNNWIQPACDFISSSWVDIENTALGAEQLTTLIV